VSDERPGHDDEPPEEARPPERDDADQAATPRPAGPRRRSSGGSILAAAMLGLRDVLYGKPKEDSIIEIESSGDPPNIDLDGLDEPIGRDHRLVGPPLDEIKARAHRRRSTRKGRHAR
jgi:hypothetical protein